MDPGTGFALIGAGIAIGAAGIGTGIAQSQFGRGIILLVLPETIVILGFVIAILLWLKS